MNPNISEALNQLYFDPKASAPYPLHPISSITEAKKIVRSADVPAIENEKSSLKPNCFGEPPNNTEVPIDRQTAIPKTITGSKI